MKKRLFSIIMLLVVTLTVSVPVHALELNVMNEKTDVDSEKTSFSENSGFVDMFAVEYNKEPNYKLGGIDELKIMQLWEESARYPVTPQMKEFGKFTLSEMQKILNPPKELLDSLSNEELASLMMDYPLLINLFAFETPEKALAALERSCAVFSEVLKRNGIESALLNEYETRSLDVDLLEGKKTYKETENYGNLPGTVFMEYYFSTYKDRISDTDKERYKNLRNLKVEGASVLCGRMLNEHIVVTGEKEYEITSVVEVKESNQLNRSLTNGFEGFNSYVAVDYYLPIPYNTHTTYYQEGAYYKNGAVGFCLKYYSNDFGTDIKNFLNSLYNGWPGFTFLSTATTRYNCHSYAWINKSFSNEYWLNDPNNFSSTYSFINSSGRAQAGDRIVIYDYLGNPVHSVYVTSGGNYQSMITVESKLGKSGVYRTSLADMMSLYQGDHYYVYR